MMSYMDKNAFANKDSQPRRGTDIQLVTESLSVDYNPPQCEAEVRVTATGHLEFLRIEPKVSGWPIFSVRWCHKDNTIDVDLIGDPAEKSNFADQAYGYYGHKTSLISENPRVHAIDIGTPLTGPVFRGSITLGIEWLRKNKFFADAVLTRSNPPV